MTVVIAGPFAQRQKGACQPTRAELLVVITVRLDHPDEKVVGATIWHSCHVSMRL